MGLGLPTRQIVLESDYESLKVKLFKSGPRGERVRATYQDLLDIGAKEGEFHWLWRSRLRDYDRQTRAWHKWLGRTLLFWNRLRYDRGRDWESGFKLYDRVSGFRTNEITVTEMGIMKSFASRCDFLVAELLDSSFGAQD